MDDPSDISTVILVHGLWFPSAGMTLLARRLERAGFAPRMFDYRTTRQPFEESADRLQDFLAREAPNGAHLLGHSLGGLLILAMLGQHRWNAPGRILFMGSPLQGSAVARRAKGWPGVQTLLGHAGGPLDSGLDGWPVDHDTGMLAGTLSIGLGRITGGLLKPNDGVVTLAETAHGSLTDRIDLPVSHTGMLFSSRAAEQAIRFFHEGHFEHAQARASAT